MLNFCVHSLSVTVKKIMMDISVYDTVLYIPFDYEGYYLVLPRDIGGQLVS
jgi:hypothetical protein